ncbi:MAG: penicillin-binding protein 2 [Bacteroidales bacterium]|nr:penicillin-binding protein 2 [Candidatus Cryptobacteroides onthequi]MCQ2165092.1 penicillin-binding protein 2 [Bacteroidales bacterium]
MTFDRKNKLLIGLGVAAGILIIKLFAIQILDDKYKRDANNNSMVYDVIYPTRGIIYDRNGKIIVGNSVAYDILVSPREVEKFDTLTLADALNVSPDFIREKMAEYRKNRSRIGYQSVVMLKKVPPQTYMKFAELQYKFPGFKGQMRSIREYPINAGGNLLGYVSEVDAGFIKNHPGEYRSGDYAGKTGIEAAREQDLKGEKGYHVYLRDSHNQIKTAYMDGEMDKEAIPGKDIVTTIDADLQEYGQLLMKDKVGSVVAIEPSTGEILAMVSSPGIDVEQLENISQHYDKIASDPYKPMFNRAVQASYPPGSVFKLVNGLIGLQEGVLKPSDSYPCYRGFPYGNGHKLGCHGHASPLALLDAIATSCNGYFCYVFRNILDNRKYDNIQESFDTWRDYVSSFGFGQQLGSDFPSELGGNIPTSAFYNKIYGKKGWKFTTIISLSIGQGEIGVTPLQIANMCATVANRGFYFIPHIIKDSEGVKIDEKYHKKNYTNVDPKYFDYAVRGMYMAVNGGGAAGGTAFAAAIPGKDVCGKTGTAQNPRGADNSVFICFAPKDDPKIAIAAYVENAGFGATWACPIASLMVEKYLNGEINPNRKYVEDRIVQTSLMSRVKKY